MPAERAVSPAERTLAVPEAPIPPSVQIARLVVAAILALALLGAALALALAGKLGAEGFAALALAALAAAGVGAATARPKDDDPPKGPRGEGGYARRGPLAALALLALGALALSGCPLPPPDGCTPRDTRCAPDGVPEVCSSTQRWARGAPSEPCPRGSTCCRAQSPYGRALHACVPAAACLPEPSSSAPAP